MVAQQMPETFRGLNHSFVAKCGCLIRRRTSHKCLSVNIYILIDMHLNLRERGSKKTEYIWKNEGGAEASLYPAICRQVMDLVPRQCQT
jgi:hypothetical protein